MWMRHTASGAFCTHTHSRNLDIQQLRNWLAAASLWVGNEIIIMETGPVSPIHNATAERPASQYSIGPLWSDPAGCRRSGVLFDRRRNEIRREIVDENENA